MSGRIEFNFEFSNPRSGPGPRESDTLRILVLGDFSGPPGLRIKMSDDDGVTAVDALHVTETGSVGIGTTVPTERLDVAGNLHVSGDLIVDGGIIGLIDISQITGLLGDGFTLHFPDVIDNTATLELSNGLHWAIGN